MIWGFFICVCVLSVLFYSDESIVVQVLRSLTHTSTVKLINNNPLYNEVYIQNRGFCPDPGCVYLEASIIHFNQADFQVNCLGSQSKAIYCSTCGL